jgi:Domain of unknown function (DUF397)
MTTLESDVPDEPFWRTARNCEGGACVRVAAIRDMILVGDSKDPGGAPLAYPRAAWRKFVQGIKEGSFDGLV